MSKCQPELINPTLGKQMHAAALALLLKHLPLGIEACKLNDELAWDIILYAALHQITPEAACQVLLGAPSGNTTREHLTAALPDSRAEFRELEAELNRTLRAQLPARVRRSLGRRQFEIALDLVPVPYHGEAKLDPNEVCRSAARDGTTHFHMYGTLQIVYHRHRYTVAVTMVWAESSASTVVGGMVAMRCATSPTPFMGWGDSEAHQVFELYRRRFGIETGYRQMHRVRAPHGLAPSGAALVVGGSGLGAGQLLCPAAASMGKLHALRAAGAGDRFNLRARGSGTARVPGTTVR